MIKEIHDRDLCQQCGGCVSFCNSIDRDIIGFKDSNSPPEFLNLDECLECGLCYLICPQTHFLVDAINKTYKFSDFSSMPLGFIQNIYSCQAIDRDFLKNATDGGVVNSIINFLMQKNLIDGAIVAKSKSTFIREAILATNKGDLINASGIKLDISPQLDKLQEFHTYMSTLPKLNQYRFKRLAIVGTPCQIYTIRCMQDLGIVPSHNVEICLGLFCYENFVFDEAKVKQFEEHFNLKFEDIEKINIKEKLIVKLKANRVRQKTIQIPFHKLNDYMRPACKACSDFTNIYADISFGGLGSPDKFTTVITRTEKGRNIILKAIKAGVIKSLDLDIVLKTQRKELITQFSQSKIERYRDFISNLSSEVDDKIEIKKLIY